MSTPELRDLLRPAMTVHFVLWFAMTASIGLYVGVALLVFGWQPGAAGLSAILQFAAGALAAIAAAISLLAPRFMLSDDRLRRGLHPRPGPIDERHLLRLPSIALAPLIVRLALNEFVAILGLVLSFIAHSVPPILPFAAAAFALNLLAFPRIEPLLDRASRLVPDR